MCLNVLRCLGVSTADQKLDSDVEEPTNRAHASAEEAAAVYPNGNGLHHPPKSTKADTAHHPGEQHHDERQIEKTEAPYSSGERSPVKAKQEEPLWDYSAAGAKKSKESPWRDSDEAAFAGAPRNDYNDHEAFAGAKKTKESGRRDYDEAAFAGANKTKESGRRDYDEAAFAGANKSKELPRRVRDEGVRGATVQADPVTQAGQYKPAGSDAYANSTYADEASIKSTWSTSQEQGTARRGQLKTTEVDDGKSSWRGSSEASDVETRLW